MSRLRAPNGVVATFVVVTLVVLLLTAACSSGSHRAVTTSSAPTTTQAATTSTPPTSIAASTTSPASGSTVVQVTSPAFPNGGELPARFTCAGAGVSPSLQWTAPPSGTVDQAIVVDDPDTASGTFVHWILTGLGRSRHSLAENERPPGTTDGPTSAGRAAYVPPCPPIGQRHHYRFTVLALGRTVAMGPNAFVDEQELGRAAIAEGILTATFGR